jgi:magnesium chelatase subunit D
VTEDDLSVAAALTLAHHATQLPEDAQEDSAPPPPDTSSEQSNDGSNTVDSALDDILVEAVTAALPQGLLTRAALQNSKGANGSGAGTRQKGQKGRPLPPRQMAQSRDRIDLIATLRAAAPWQTVRRKARGTDRLVILKTDLRHKRHEDRSDRLLIFTVDASGSSAMARLAETKGAIELLLAEAYASRDHVALVAFRGEGADVLLPPTRSLVQTKRRLAALPGGGGTPLAAGLFEAGRLAHQSRGRGLAPTLILLTDGRANIALDGTGKRAEAQRDAQEVATTLRHAGTRGLVIDTGRRPSSDLAQLSNTLDSPYVPLPHANAHSLQETVATALGR